MSVNYLVEINSLDDWELTHPLSETAYKLMRKLQYLANKERFPRTISVPNSMLIAMVGCSKDSLIRARNQLIQEGLIHYKGQKRLCPLYEIQYFSERVKNDKSKYATYPATLTATYPTTLTTAYPANTYINKIKENGEEESTDDRRDARACVREAYNHTKTPEDRRHLRAAQAFLEQLERTEYAELFSNPVAMRQILLMNRFPFALIGEALDKTFNRHLRYPLMDGASYALQLLVDWTSNGINTPEELRERYDTYFWGE